MRTMRKFFGFFAAVTLLAVGPASAITNGELDGADHPHVGLIVFDVGGGPSHRCTGTLIHPQVMLTAGHCTDGISGGRVWFESNDEAGIRDGGYPFGGPTAIEIIGWATHPLFDPNAFFLHDLGLVLLNAPVVLPEYGVLPDLNVLNQLATRRGKQNQTFTAVGYGLQQITSNPMFTVRLTSELVRYSATPRLVQINTPGFTGNFSILLSNNHSTGGTCFGDSGGPNFIGDTNVVAGVTSFGLNGNCAGTGGVYRVDTADDLLWLASFGL